MQQRKGLSTDFQCLKARGYKPFFRGATLKYRDGPLIRKCARGEANKVVEAAAQVPQMVVFRLPMVHCLRGIMIQIIVSFLKQRMRLFA